MIDSNSDKPPSVIQTVLTRSPALCLVFQGEYLMSGAILLPKYLLMTITGREGGGLSVCPKLHHVQSEGPCEPELAVCIYLAHLVLSSRRPAFV